MINILVFSPHPDDAELCVGGTIIKHSDKYSIIIVDLSIGECSANGNNTVRQKEIDRANALLGINERICLDINDCEISSNSTEQLKKVIYTIRKYRPSIIISPYMLDNHPDHKETYKLIKSAFKRCKYIYYYSQDIISNNCNKLYIDITDIYDKKLLALEQYKSQFKMNMASKVTYLNKYMIQKITSKDTYNGALIGCEYAEELLYDGLMVCDNIFDYELYY